MNYALYITRRFVLDLKNNNYQHNKIVAAIHDLSGIGRCSLSVIMPILSAMGIQVCAVPTAILSSHTGGLGDNVTVDLNDYVKNALSHYKTLGIEFNAIYSGYLNSHTQADNCIAYMQNYPNALKVVDPVMGDHGKLYKACTADLCREMKELAAQSDVITPNLTEAVLLLDEDYSNLPLTVSFVKSMLVRLSQKGPRVVCITKIQFADGSFNNVGYDRERDAFWRVELENLPVNYPGTGDMFAAIIVGALLHSDSLPIALERATRFLEIAIKTTYGYGTDPRYGVLFEQNLGWLSSSHSFGQYKKM